VSEPSDLGPAAESSSAAWPLQFAKELGRAIERERLRREWTAEEAANRAGVSAKTWQRLEDGKVARSNTYAKIDRVFNLDPGTIMQYFYEGGDVSSIFDLPIINPDLTFKSIQPLHDYDFTPRPPTLADRVAGLSLGELRRLRDMVDAAIASKEHPAIDEELATAAVSAADASALLSRLEANFSLVTDRLARLSDGHEREASRTADLLMESQSALKEQIRSAMQSVMVTQDRYAALRYKAAAVERGKKMFDSSGREETGEERGDG
jgi:transcriptional regulator with XRE-family HTH domain